MTNMMVMEFLDLTVAAAGGSDDGMEEPEMYWIVGQVPGTSRYLFCTTVAHSIGLWDLYERRCVRIIETGEYFTRIVYMVHALLCFGCSLYQLHYSYRSLLAWCSGNGLSPIGCQGII